MSRIFITGSSDGLGLISARALIAQYVLLSPLQLHPQVKLGMLADHIKLFT